MCEDLEVIPNCQPVSAFPKKERIASVNNARRSNGANNLEKTAQKAIKEAAIRGT